MKKSTREIIRDMAKEGYWLVIRDAQMWEAMFREPSGPVWEGDLFKSCDMDTAIEGAAALAKGSE